MTFLLRVENMSVEYPNGIKALSGLDLALMQGEIVCVLGANGAGKTTLLKAICGLILPSTGQISWGTPGGQRPQLGVLLEGSRAFYWNLTGWENAAYFSTIKGLSEKGIEKHLSELFRLLGLWDARHRLSGDYSSGMKKRLSLLIALIGNPLLVLLDEPTAGLDRESVLEFEDYLRRVAQQGTTVLCATHELSFAFTVASRIVYLEAGQLRKWDWLNIQGRHRRAIFLLGGEVSNTMFDGYLRSLGENRWQLEGATDDRQLFGILNQLLAEYGLHLLQIYGID